MSYLGQVELKSSEIRRVDVTGSTSATHTLTWTPASEQSLIITINGIKQQNNYSISGTTLTLDDALLSADAMEVIGILDIGEAVVPPDDSITTAMVKDDAIDADKLANSINTEIAANTAKVTNATHTGDVTGATALTIATDAVDIAMLSATGTADATTFLRGDNAWATAGGNNTPAFYAYLTSNRSVSDNTTTKLECDGEVFDSDSAYDNSTDYRFTVPAGEGGKYLVSVGIGFGNGNDSGRALRSMVYVNGSQKAFTYWGQGSSGHHLEDPFLMCQTILVLSATDYVEAYGRWDITSGGPIFAGNDADNRPSYFHAFKLVGV